jgi:ankyrin repeat protein
LDHGVNIESVNKMGYTPVLDAAEACAPHCLEMLIERGANVKAFNSKQHDFGLYDFAAIFDGEDSNRPYMLTTTAEQVNRRMATMQMLLDKGLVDINAPDKGGFTPLDTAIINGQTAWTEMLLKRGAELNTVGPNGRTPLITAIMSAVKETRYFQLLDELLARGADPNAGIDNPIGAGYRVPSPLKAAMCGNQTLENRRKVVGSLLAHGARFSVPKGSDAEKMLLAATAGDDAAVTRLLANGVSPNVTDSRGWTPLISAAALDYDPVLKTLANAGADVNAHDALGAHALGFAADNYPDLTDIRLLLDKGADINASSSLDPGYPVLYIAIAQSDPVLLRELLKRGASPNVLPKAGENWFTPLEEAVEILMEKPTDQKCRDVVTILLAAGADPNPRRRMTNPLLYTPVMNNMTDLLKFLINAGIDPKKDPDGGKGLIDVVEWHGNAETKSLIYAVLGQTPKPAK